MNEQTIKLFSSEKTDNWQTPIKLKNKIYEEFDINFDPCPLNPTFDGLEIDWIGNIFVNPPYSQIQKWLIKAHEELRKKAKVIVFLTFANTDTKWFHRYCLGDGSQIFNSEIRFIKGRLKFLDQDGIQQNSAMRPSILVILKK